MSDGTRIKARAFKASAITGDLVQGGYTVTGAVTAGRIAAGDSHALVLRDDGVLWSWGANASGQLGDGTTTQRLIPGWVNGLTGAT